MCHFAFLAFKMFSWFLGRVILSVLSISYIAITLCCNSMLQCYINVLFTQRWNIYRHNNHIVIK